MRLGENLCDTPRSPPRTVRDLVVGSDIAVEDRGPHMLKGIEGSWQLFAVTET